MKRCQYSNRGALNKSFFVAKFFKRYTTSVWYTYKMVSHYNVTKVLIILAIILISSVNAIFIIDANSTRSKMKTKNMTPADWTELGDDGLWSEILEDWTLRYVKKC